MLRRWTIPLVAVVAWAAMAAVQFAVGHRSTGIVIVILLVLASVVYVSSPLYFPRHTTAAEAQRRSAADGRPVVYWRPGCPYCLRLRTVLGRQGRRAHWVDIWRDPDGAAAVREVAGGNETVPTVVMAGMAGQAYVNPKPVWLRRRLRALP